MLHHYLEFIDFDSVVEAEQWSAATSAEYLEIERGTFNGRNRPHYQLEKQYLPAVPLAGEQQEQRGRDLEQGQHVGEFRFPDGDFQTPVLFPGL